MPATSLADWSRTGATIVSVGIAAVGVIRWTQSVDDRLGVIDMKLNIFTTQAAAAADTAKIYAAQAADAAQAAQQAAIDTREGQGRLIRETRENRGAIADQSKNVVKLKEDMKRQLDSLEWRIRMLEEVNRKALDKK